jgi:hypothetical protein
MNINRNQWVRKLFLGAILTSVSLLMSPVRAQQGQPQQEPSADAVRRLAQQAGGKIDARHVVGLENIKRNRSGSLIVLNGELQFQTGKMNANLPLASIDDISVGTEITQAGGRAGTVTKTAAMAAPYDSGAGLSILLRTTVDTLTVSNRDSGGGLHYAILALSKGQGEQLRAQMITAGAHVRTPSGQGLQGGKPAAPKAPTAQGLKLSHSAIQIEPVDAGDVWIPTEFRAAIYEYLVMRVRESGYFQQVFRSADRAADSVRDLVILHATVEKFKQGSQMEREITTVLGSTNVGVDAWVTDRDGRVLLADRVQGKVRFFGENLGATNDLAKHIAKRLKQE